MNKIDHALESERKRIIRAGLARIALAGLLLGTLVAALAVQPGPVGVSACAALYLAAPIAGAYLSYAARPVGWSAGSGLGTATDDRGRERQRALRSLPRCVVDGRPLWPLGAGLVGEPRREPVEHLRSVAASGVGCLAEALPSVVRHGHVVAGCLAGLRPSWPALGRLCWLGHGA